MSFKFHQVALTKICRICSNKIRVTDRKPILCKDYNKEIKTVFDVSTWEDVSGQHPHSLCDLCGRKVRHQRAGTREYDSGKVKNRQTVVGTEWPKHQRTGSCYVCDLFHQQEKGGPRQKPKRGPQPVDLENQPELPFDTTIENIFPDLRMPTQTCQQDVPPHFEVFGHCEHNLFICAICMCLLNRPCVQTPCKHNFCATCLSAY